MNRPKARGEDTPAADKSQSPLKILVLTLDVPATNNMPGSPRLFNLCRHLSRRHRLTLLTPNPRPNRLEAFRDDPSAAGVFERILVLPDPPAVGGWWGTQLHRLRREVYFATRYRHRQYHADQCRYVRTLVEEGEFDVVYVDTIPVAQYLMDAGVDCPAIIDLHDCLTLLYHRTMRVERNWLRKLALYLETRSVARCERSLRSRFGAIITNSPVDEAYFNSVAPGANTLTIANGVDTTFFDPSELEGESRRLVFTGVMHYGPNEDAAIHFAEEVLPLIRQRQPTAEFWIVGEGPTERVRRVGEQAGVHVTGAVPDVRAYLKTCGIFVCPLRYGSGVKNKLLAALAMRKPVVATRRSLDGLDLRENEHVLVADDPKEFAAKVVQLIETPALARRLASNGRAFVADQFSWERSATTLEEVLRHVVRGGAPGAASAPRAFGVEKPV